MIINILIIIQEHMAIVKFVAIGSKKNIGDQCKYADNILTELERQGYIDKYEIYPDDKYQTTFICRIDKDNITFTLVFQFETYRSLKQLAMEISSDDYMLDVDDSFLENLKLFIKKLIIPDWNKIVWLYDEDAYVLSKDLYSRFYVTENNMRRFINEFMLKTFGIEWWDTLSDQSIKNKYNARFKGYKTVVPGFNNVDDHLISIDVGDLLKIMTMKKLEWNPKYNADIEKLLVDATAGNVGKIVESMKEQLTVKEDFWEKYFKLYFDDDFTKSFREFEANRNHVAHNKILDRTAYKSIKRSIEKIDDYMNKALLKLSKDKKSIEQLKVEAQEYEELLLETKQNDAGVTISNLNRIAQQFGDVLNEKYNDIVEALRFREDIEITESLFESGNYSGKLFSAVSKVTNEQLDFYYSMDINDDEGAESTLIITCEQEPFVVDEFDDIEGFIIRISYINGSVTYDDEQGYYMPFAEEGISQNDINNYVETMIDFINIKLESLKDYVDSIRYETVKDGGEFPIAPGVYCDECYEEYICINENLAEVGTCLNCGAHNEIAVCERCGNYFVDYCDDEIKLCDLCKEHYEED